MNVCKNALIQVSKCERRQVFKYETCFYLHKLGPLGFGLNQMLNNFGKKKDSYSKDDDTVVGPQV